MSLLLTLVAALSLHGLILVDIHYGPVVSGVFVIYTHCHSAILGVDDWSDGVKHITDRRP